jgi:hypothetical protein
MSKKKPSRKAPKKKAARRRPKKAKAKKAARRRRPKAKKAVKKTARRRRPKKAKAKKSSRRRRPKKMKAAPKRRKRRVSAKTALKRLSRASSAAARAMGMMKGARKNPGGILDFLKGEARDMMAIAPSVAVQLGSMAAIGYVSAKASERIKKMVVGEKIGEEKTKAEDGFAHKYAGAISSGAITIAAFAAMKMVKSEKAKQFTLPVLFGGMAATLVQVLAAVKVEPKKIEGQPAPATPLPKISLGQRLGLPIGDYMALSGFLDIHGRPLAINGMGDYVPQALGEFGELELSKGQYGEGTVVTSMGDYVPQALGDLTLHEGRFQEGTVLGEIGQMSEGRQGARALNSPGDLTVESFVDSGSLSGSVFD